MGTKRIVGTLLVGFLCCGCLQVETNPLDSSAPGGLLSSLIIAYLSRTANFVMVGENCSSWGSDDGSEWSQGTEIEGCNRSGSAALYDVAAGPSLFVAVGSTDALASGCGIFTSTSGYLWTKRACPGGVTQHLSSVTYSEKLGLYVAGGAFDGGATCRTLFSSNGINWTLSTAAPVACAGGDKIQSVAPADSGTSAVIGVQNVTAFSTSNGNNWAATGAPALGTISSVEQISSTRTLLVGFAAGNGASQTSDNNGTTWSGFGGVPFAETLIAAAFGGGRVVAVADNCRLANSTDNGTSWDATVSFGGNCDSVNWKDIIYGDGRFIAVGNQAGTFVEVTATSSTGTSGSWVHSYRSNSNGILAVTKKR